jgi:hypothetical protein
MGEKWRIVFGFVDIPGILAWIIYLGLFGDLVIFPMLYDITLLFAFVMGLWRSWVHVLECGQDQYIEIFPFWADDFSTAFYNPETACRQSVL